MPTKIEKDSVTGTDTTGHVWDGIRELNTPLPKWWLYVFFACIVWAFGYYVFYPSWPLGTHYIHGVLGYSSRTSVNQAVAAVHTERAASMDRIAALPFDKILADKQLSEVALTGGRLTFAEKCAPCHGAGGSGRPGYPALAAGAWIWGGKLSDIVTTLEHGIRSGDPKARDDQMPAFGAGTLKPEQIDAVATTVWKDFYGHANAPGDAKPGHAIFAENCAPCHGESGQGSRELGAPRLASHVHLYGDSYEQIVTQIRLGRGGVMPAWGLRLDQATLKSVALYVHALGGGE